MRRKRFQITYFAKNLHSEYIKNTKNVIIRLKIG